MSTDFHTDLPEHKLAAIMFTDIVGYTVLMGADEEKALELLRKSRAIQQSLIANYNGKWLKEMGDGVLAQFNSAFDSVCCAIEIQNRANRELECKIRIGIHLGDVTVENDDIFGDGVNIASRIQSIAAPGGIYVSESIQNAVRSKADINLEYLGEVHLKNVSDPIKTYYVKKQFLPIPSDNRIRKLTGGDRKRIRLIAMIVVTLSVFVAIYWFEIRESFAISDEIKSIAVLAFTDLSPNQDQEYFSDGISEELLNLLAKIPELRVISKTSSFSYKGQNVTLEKIGKELGVTHILEGSVRKSGNTFRITTQLIKVADGYHLWSETYDRDMDDIFKIQDEIAGMVTKQLKITLLGDITKTAEVNTDAYTLYLQANHLVQQFTDKTNMKAEKVVLHSIAIDSTYAPSWLLLGAINYNAAILFSQKTQKEGLKIAKAAVENAIGLDDNFGLAYALLSSINMQQWDFDAANDNINKAMILDGGNSIVISNAAANAMNSGRLVEAKELYLQSIRVNPLSISHYLWLGCTYYFLNCYDKALDAYNMAVFLDPNSDLTHSFQSLALTSQDKHIEALKESEKEPNEFWNLYARSKALFTLGRQSEADSLLEQLIDRYSEFGASNIAEIYAYRGEINNAFEWLDIAYELPEKTLLFNLNFSSFSNLYNDPRWDAFIARMKLPKDHWLLDRL